MSNANEKRLEQEIMQLLREQGGSEVDITRSITDGINKTAKDVQMALQKMLTRKLTFRSPTTKKFFLQRMAKISLFAKNNSHKAVVQTQNIQGAIAEEFEVGGTETPKAGKQVLMTPTTTARGGDDNKKVLMRYRFERLGLKRQGDALEGDKGVYAVKGVGVFQRTKRGGSKLLYAASPHRVIRKLLRWRVTAKAVVQAKLMINIREAHIARMARRSGKGKP